MRVTNPNSVALNVMTDDGCKELMEDADLLGRILRAKYAESLKATELIRKHLDENTRTRLIIRQHLALRGARR